MEKKDKIVIFSLDVFLFKICVFFITKKRKKEKVKMDEIESSDDEDNIGNELGLKYYLKHKWKLGVTLFSFITMVRYLI